MKYLKTYEEITDPSRLLKFDLPRYLSTVTLKQVGEHVYSIVVRDRHSRAMIFLRAQEYYESRFEEIFSKKFKINKLIDLYKKSQKRNVFTYGFDWPAFNIPSDILEECMFNIDEDDINNYDKIMISIINTIRKREQGHNYYVIGVDEDDFCLEHEFAHAMYFTIPDYRNLMVDLYNRCDPEVKKRITKSLVRSGYADKVVPDEFQAYMIEGGLGYRKPYLPAMQAWTKRFRKVFNSFYKDNLYEPPIDVKIEWDMD